MRALVAAFALCLPTPMIAQSYLVVVTGLPGTPAHRAAFDSSATAIVASARSRLGLPDSRLVRLGEATSPPGTAAEVLRALERLAARAEPEATVTLILIGHGSATDGQPRFHLPGPDLTVAALAGTLGRFRTQEVVILQTASTSGAWIEALAGPRRTVVTATRSAAERDETVFARYLAAAFGDDASDLDRDGRVSVRELFDHARLAVDRHYRDLRRLRTEHALLDDNGDGRGTLVPADSGDGRRAALVFLDGAAAAGAVDPAVAALLARRDSLYAALRALRDRRAALDSARYEQALDTLALDIARNGRALRARRPGGAQ